MVPDKVLGIGDVRKALAGNMIPGMKDAEAAMALAEQLCTAHQLGDSDKLHAIGLMSVNLVLATIKKVHKDLPKLQPVSDAGRMFIEHLRVLAKNPNIASPWVASASASSPQDKPAASKAKMPKSTAFLGVYKREPTLIFSYLKFSKDISISIYRGNVLTWADLKKLKAASIGLQRQIRRCGIVEGRRLCSRHAGEEKVGWHGGNHQADDPKHCVASGWGR